VSIMITTTLITMIFFVLSFIKARASAKNNS
jgi:hypothetical protein